MRGRGLGDDYWQGQPPRGGPNLVDLFLLLQALICFAIVARMVRALVLGGD